MVEKVFAVVIAWVVAGLANWHAGGSRIEVLGLGLILLPVSLNIVSPVSGPVIAVSVIVGLSLFIIANKRRCSRSH